MLEAWGLTAKKNWSQVQVLQNLVMRYIYNLHPRTPRVEMFNLAATSIVPIKALHHYTTCKFVFQALKNLTMINLKFEIGVGQIAQKNQTLHVARTFTSYGDNRISVNGAKLFNSLSSHIKDSKNLREFKDKCYKFYKININDFLN